MVAENRGLCAGNLSAPDTHCFNLWNEKRERASAAAFLCPGM